MSENDTNIMKLNSLSNEGTAQNRKELEEEWAQALVKLLVEAIKVKNQEQVVE
jgi:hypothetical protein